MAASNVPEPWASAMEAVGAVNPQTGRASLNALSHRADVHTTTLSNLVQGRTHSPDLETIKRIAQALRKPTRVVANWVGINWVENKPYVPPKEADLLDQSERDTLDKLIRHMAKYKTGQQDYGDSDGSPPRAPGRQGSLFSHK